MKFNAKINYPETYTLEGFGDDRITVSNRMLLRNGRPFIPVMGEMQYSRVPRECWREGLQKMKDGGIEVIASYVIWLHHEEKKGVFDFTGNRDLRAYVELCHELGLEFCLRPGPWIHGECRNGGFPDWIVEECDKKHRRVDESPYIDYARRFYAEIARQLEGLELFGIQIENELKNRPEHLETLRKMALELGLHAPIMTATGWGKAVLPDTLLPIFGGYPEAPWTQNVLPLPENPNFFFSAQWDDGNIATDLSGVAATDTQKYRFRFPYLTCELGGGNQVTYHRRPLIHPREISSLVRCKIGGGANLVGYYVYHGGQNPISKTTTQESRATGYPNDCPVVSYDFEAPIGDQGQLRESYVRQKSIHSFLHHFGELLAPMDPIVPDVMPKDIKDTETLRCFLRSAGDGGFLFVNNYERLKTLPEHKGEHFEIEFTDRRIEFELDVPSGVSFILPVSLTLAGLPIKLATANPIEMTDNTLTFESIDGVLPRIILENGEEIVLKYGKNRICDTTVTLIAPEEYVPDEGYPIEVARVENELSADLLIGHLGLADKTVEYLVKWTDRTKYLVIRADGNLAGFYVDGMLISDFYLYGDAWVIDLRRIDAREGRIKIQPLTEEDAQNIYFEVTPKFGEVAPRVFGFDQETIRI